MTDALAATRKALLPAADGASDHSDGMSYLETIPRRIVTLYLPLILFLIVLVLTLLAFRLSRDRVYYAGK